MPEELDTSARERFARDLCQIREDREVSLTALQEATQVPKSRLRAFEEGELIDEQSRMNAVYLKAFVRAYAEAIGLSPDIGVDHVEAALSGDYENELAAQYLERRGSGAEAPSSSENKSSSGEPTGEDISSTSTSTSEASETTPSSDIEGEENSKDEPSAPKDPSHSVQTGDKAPVASQDRRASLNKSSESSSRSTARRERGDGRGEWKPLVYGAAAIALLALSAWGIVTYPFSSNGPFASPAQDDSGGFAAADAGGPAVQKTVDTTQSTDAADVTEADQLSGGASASVSLLRDTMHITVRARAVVREMRIQQDSDLRRPYWMEPGDALVFPFTRRITIENQLDSLRLFLEGHPYSTTHANAEGRIVITRDTVARVADTLRSSPVSLTETPDTVQIGSVQSSPSVSTSSDTADGTL